MTASLRRASLEGVGYEDYFQAGKSVSGIDAIESAEDVVRRFAEAVRASEATSAAARR